METTAQYTRVGLFVILFTVILIIGGLWLSVGLSGQSYNKYIVYMHESVSGLSVKAPVKYNGVEIGYVEDINLYKKDPQKVKLILAIQATIPIYNGTKAVLDTQGLTGIASLELKGGVVSQGLLVTKKGKKYPVIPSAPSLFFRLDAALDDLTSNIKDISSGLKEFLNPQNAEAVKNTLQNFSSISDDLHRNSVKLDQIIDDAQITLKNTAKVSEQLPSVMSSIKQSSNQLAASASKANILLSNGSTAMETVNNQLMPQIINSMTNIQEIIGNIKSVSQQMSEDPSVIIRGKVQTPAGPGE